MRDVAGAEKHDIIAGRNDFADHRRQHFGRGKAEGPAVAVRLDRPDQRVAIDALDLLLAGGVDIGDDHGVRVIEAGGELIEQRLQPGEAMRLHHRDDLALGRGARRAQHRRDLHRMMRIVVEDRDAVPLAGLGEAPLDAAKAR